MKTARIAYFDCFSGISGDMVLGALVDAGVDMRAIEAELRKLGLEGWSISAEKVKRGAIFATHMTVASSEGHHHRGLSVILGRIDKAGLGLRSGRAGFSRGWRQRKRKFTTCRWKKCISTKWERWILLWTSWARRLDSS